MFKKITIATAFSAALLFGGAITNVDASASIDSSQSQANVSQHKDSQGFGHNYVYSGNIQEFLNHFFNINKVNWHSGNKQETPDDANSNEANNDKEGQTPEETEQNQKQEQNQASQQTEQNQNNAISQAEKSESQSSDSSGEHLNAFEQEVVSLTNDERVSRGLEPLKEDAELSAVARDKSDDMRSGGYFSHNSPTYGSPFDMMESYGITYRTAGENIARGQRSPEEVVNGWMNSQGHRENILNPKFTHIGVGYVEQGNYWTQEFTGQ